MESISSALLPTLFSLIITSLLFVFWEDLALNQAGTIILSNYAKENNVHPYCGLEAFSRNDSKGIACSFQKHNGESTLFLGENELMKVRDSIRFHRNVPSLCDFDVDLLIIIVSTVGAYDNRQAIRDTWKSVAALQHVRSRVKTAFVIPTKSDFDERRTRDESEKYNDVIQVQFYEGTTTAVLLETLALTWFKKYCFNAMFYLKTNDRFVLNLEAVKKIVPALVKMPDLGTAVFGKVLDKSPAIRSGPRSTCEFFYPFKKYPAYMSEETYLMHRDVVLKIDEGIKNSFFFPLADVYVSGLTTALVGINLIDTNKVITGFSASFWNDANSLGYISSDRSAMQEHWKAKLARVDL